MADLNITATDTSTTREVIIGAYFASKFIVLGFLIGVTFAANTTVEWIFFDSGLRRIAFQNLGEDSKDVD
jgi:hypothetical protein